MRSHLAAVLCVAFLATAAVRADPGVTPDEMAAKDQWIKQTLLSMDSPVVSFRYDGNPSANSLIGWRHAPIETRSLSEGRTQYVMQWSDPATGLEVRVVAVDYSDYPAVEWTAYIKNGGTTAAPILEDVRGIDSHFGSASKETILRTIRGDSFSASSYEPQEFKLDRDGRTFQPEGGRPTNAEWPYWNIDNGQSGVLLALGWPGQWQARFDRTDGRVSVAAGQQTLRARLQPGEEIRTPLVAVLFWKGNDWLAGQNLWRHWFIAHNIPKPGGKPPKPFTAVCMGLHQSAAGEKAFIDSYRSHGAKTDYWWLDAGWYEGAEWFAAKGVGTWAPDPVRFPHGIREVSDYSHRLGMKLVVWFEPERVYRGSFLWDNHPDWLMHWNGDEGVAKDLKLLNLGNPAARQWLTERISRFITEQGVDLYRQDFNLDPLVMWQNHDTPERQGMTENLYVQGYLAYWDALLQQHPGMLIDSCASGGRRNDLETLRRSVPLLRSDYQASNMPAIITSADVFDGNQGHTYGLSLWIPFYGTGDYAEDVYSARSHLCSLAGIGTRTDNPDWAAVRRQISDHSKATPYFYGDYYPLTSYSKATDVWIAWEFVGSDQEGGMIQAFRRELCPAPDVTVKLQGLNSDADYDVTDIDTGKTERFGGKKLLETGLNLHAVTPRTALILTFKEVK